MRSSTFGFTFSFALALATFAAEAGMQDFYATWNGTLSGMPIQVKIWAYGTDAVENMNATFQIQNYYETAEVLGYKASTDTLYLFRQADKAPFAMYRTNGMMYLEYWEAKGAPRKALLTKGR